MAKAEKTKKEPEVETNVPATVKTGEVAAALPDYMKGHAGKGGELADSSKLLIPRITLLQALSKEVQEGGLKQGEFYHTVTEESLGSEVRFVPILFRSQFILWNPRENGGGILARADDGIHWNPADQSFTVKIDKKGNTATWITAKTVKESGLDQWGSFDPSDPKSQPAATEMYTFLIAFPDYPSLGLAVLALQRSQIKVARKLLTSLKFSELPFYGQKFVMKSTTDTNKTNQTFNNFKFVRDGIAGEEEFKRYARYYEQFKDEQFDIKDLDAAQDEGAVGDDEGVQADGKKEF